MSLPSIKDLYQDLQVVQKNDAFLTLINQPPKNEWVKEHPFIRGYKYLPIERIEFLLKTIFKNYKIEITGQGQSFNGVWVTVRIHYMHPLTGEWLFHDGIGAIQLQTAKGTSPADLANINNGALSMAYPHAKTLAIKDACDSFGLLFGSDLNRKDLISYSLDLTLIDMDENHPNWSKVVQAIKDKSATLEQVKSKYNLTESAQNELSKL
jgi:hypothetical protein